MIRVGLVGLVGMFLPGSRECPDMLGGVVSTYPTKGTRFGGLSWDSVGAFRHLERLLADASGRFSAACAQRTPKGLGGAL